MTKRKHPQRTTGHFNPKPKPFCLVWCRPQALDQPLLTSSTPLTRNQAETKRRTYPTRSVDGETLTTVIWPINKLKETL